MAEVDRLTEKIERAGISQVGRMIELIKRRQSPEYEAVIRIQLNENGKETTLSARVEFDLQVLDVNAENPWGFKVDRFTQTVSAGDLKRQKLNSAGVGRAVELEIQPRASATDSGVLIQFPCLVENVELQKSTALRVRLSTLDVSELEIAAVKPTAASETVRVLCSNRAFQFGVRAASRQAETRGAGSAAPSDHPIFIAFRNQDGVDRQLSERLRRPRAKFEKTLEEQLGFVTD